MSTVIVAGGAGYIGSHTIRELKNGGFEPIVLDNLVYGHRKIVEDVLGVPLVIGHIGDKQLLGKLLSGEHPSTKGKDIKGDIGEDHNPETQLIPLVLEALFNKDGFIRVNRILQSSFRYWNLGF